MWKTRVAIGLAALFAMFAQAGAAHAQSAEQPVHWELQVVRDGKTIDTFEATTAVGQAHTDTHHDTVVHDVGCKDRPAGSIDLSRTLTVSPTEANAREVTLAIDAQETLEDDAAAQTTEGCALPPQPREVSASHQGLPVPNGEWASWTIVDKNPTLVYRVRASIAPSGTN